jgi:hypothetical protein
MRLRTSAPPLASTIILVHRLADDNALSPPPCCSMITHRISHDDELAVSTRSLRRPTVARPEALAVASPGQAWLQILDLTLIPIVGICPHINYMKLDKHTHRDYFYRQAYVSHALTFLLFLFFLLNSRYYKLTQNLACICNTQPTDLALLRIPPRSYLDSNPN